MSEFKWNPKPPPEIPADAGWDDTLRRAINKDGIGCSHTLQGYWDNACDQAEEEGIPMEDRPKWARQNAIESLIDNLNDMSKEDAITTLVDLYAENVL